MRKGTRGQGAGGRFFRLSPRRKLEAAQRKKYHKLRAERLGFNSVNILTLSDHGLTNFIIGKHDNYWYFKDFPNVVFFPRSNCWCFASDKTERVYQHGDVRAFAKWYQRQKSAVHGVAA